MKKDIFKEKSGWIISALSIAIIFGSTFLPVRTRNKIWTAFLLTYGILEIYNYTKNKKISYLVSGAGFVLLSLITVLNVLFIINVQWIFIWLGALALILITTLIEYLTKTN